jgi:galactose mutarotase-like enzyme
MIYTIKNEKLTISVSSKGAELISAKSTDGKEYIWQADKSYWGRHAPILFPVCGRLLGSEYTLGGVRYEMGSHGFARDSEFELVQISENSLTLMLKQNESTAAIYPFNFTLTVNYSLNDSMAIMRIDVKNDDSKIMPYMIGWHPGFNINGLIDNYSIRVNNGETVKRNYMKSSLFIEPQSVDYPLDNCSFKLTEKEIYGEDTIILKDIGGESELVRDGQTVLRIKQSDNLPFYAIWKAPNSNAEYICLEPWSDIPSDGITPECFDTRKMSRLEGGKSESYIFSVEFVG